MIGLRLLAVLALVAVNGFFAAAEYSLIAVRVSRVRLLIEQGDARARVVQELLGELDRVISGVQVGITLASLALGALGESTLAQIFRPLLDWLPGSRAALVAHGVALALAFGLLTVLQVVLGELTPKMVSLQRAERTALVIARPFSWYLNTFRPVIELLDGISRRTVRTMGIQPPTTSHTAVHSSEELQIQIHQAQEHGLLETGEAHFMLRALELGQTRVREIMVPRPDVHALPVGASLDEILAMFATTQRSRIPVFEGTLDHVLGFLHVKDILWVLLERERRIDEGAPAPPFEIRRLLREVLIVPESKLAGELLVEMRGRRQSLAIIVDEFGSVVGLVTLEDILEQLVGEIHDEFDVEKKPLLVGKGSEAGMVFDGGTSLRDLETQYHIALPEDPAYSTLGGFMLAQLGFIPKGGEGFVYAGYRFTIAEMDRRRVARVKVQLLKQAPAGAASGAAIDTPSSESTATTGGAQRGR